MSRLAWKVCWRGKLWWNWLGAIKIWSTSLIIRETIKGPQRWHVRGHRRRHHVGYRKSRIDEINMSSYAISHCKMNGIRFDVSIWRSRLIKQLNYFKERYSCSVKLNMRAPRNCDILTEEVYSLVDTHRSISFHT